MMFLWILAVFAVLSEKVVSDQRIVKGQVAEPHSIPFQVALFVKRPGNKNILCGGSLINEKTILTAAHCMKNSISATAIMGAHDLSAKEPTVVQTVNSSNFKLHPKFNFYPGNPDIALITLNFPVKFTTNIQPVELPSEPLAKENFVGEIGKVSGFGQFCDDCGSSNVLRYTQNIVISHDECESSPSGFGIYPTENQICLSTEEDKSGSCRGDSGGPLTIVRNETAIQIGVTSFGFRKCEEGAPTVFTRLNKKLLQWVLSGGEN